MRAQDGKGRHTTVHRELVPLPTGGVLIDTPGRPDTGHYSTGHLATTTETDSRPS
ncbi:GTPase RsgA [Nonomuraea sp. NPDC049480]|uniref:GTPase RsgA n=1 Tax=Nonomuraea sp. NPDC049480 TaxID=3364353 RepID=UPI00378FB9C4